MPKKMDYTPELGAEICDVIAHNRESLESLCKRHAHWPSPATIYKWAIHNPSFAEAYTRAKDVQVEAYVDDIMVIANDADAVFYDNDGKPHFNTIKLQRDRLKIDSIKWLAGKLKAKKYGEVKQDESKSDDDFISKNRDKL